MNFQALPPRGLTPSEARELQLQFGREVVREAPEGFAPTLVAGMDLSIRRGRDMGHAAIAVLEVGTLRTVDQVTASVPVEFPYVPGLLSFRELPPLAAAWEKLTVLPQLILFDGHGLAHPRRFGLACHGGILFDVPSIGSAKSILVGDHPPLAEARGATAPLRHDGEEVGVALRTRGNISPVYVSIGHRMDLPTAVEAILQVSPCYRIPEPIRRAHRLCNEARSRSGG